jgi:rhodanese-related sulfurtransferase
MRIIISLILILTFSCSTNSVDNYYSISIDKAAELLESENAIILDVRTNEEVSKGYIKDATFIDYYSNDFKNKLNLIDKKKTIYVYCKSGGRSSKASEIISQMGFANVYNLEGGFMRWKLNDMPFNLDSASTQVLNNDIVLQSDIDSILLSNNKVLLCVSTQWCLPCKKMEPIINKINLDLKGNIHILKLDPDYNPLIIKKYNILSLPTFVLYEDNLEVWRKNGIIAYDDLVNNF